MFGTMTQSIRVVRKSARPTMQSGPQNGIVQYSGTGAAHGFVVNIGHAPSIATRALRRKSPSNCEGTGAGFILRGRKVWKRRRRPAVPGGPGHPSSIRRA